MIKYNEQHLLQVWSRNTGKDFRENWSCYILSPIVAQLQYCNEVTKGCRNTSRETLTRALQPVNSNGWALAEVTLEWIKEQTCQMPNPSNSFIFPF